MTGSADWDLDFDQQTVFGPQEMSDPRVSGEMYGTPNTEGEYIAFVESDGQRNITAWMEGSGAYEDLSYVQHAHGQSADVSITGLVDPGGIPPTVVLGMDGPLLPAPPLPED